MLLQEIFVNLKLNVLCRQYFFKMFLQARLSVDKLGEHFPACSGKIREVGLPVVVSHSFRSLSVIFWLSFATCLSFPAWCHCHFSPRFFVSWQPDLMCKIFIWSYLYVDALLLKNHNCSDKKLWEKLRQDHGILFTQRLNVIFLTLKPSIGR